MNSKNILGKEELEEVVSEVVGILVRYVNEILDLAELPRKTNMDDQNYYTIKSCLVRDMVEDILEEMGIYDDEE